MNSKKDLRNCLVQYQGGGYDGCFWEWNYFFIDEDGEFNDIFSSGRNGVKNEKKFKNFDWEQSGVYIYNLTDEKQAEELVKETNEDNILMLARVLYDDFDFNLIGTCDECKREFSLYDAHHSGYEGNGGIGVIYTGVVCSDCYFSGICDDCNEYVGQDDITYLEEESKALCSYCIQSHLNEALPPQLINKILFENSDFDLGEVKAHLRNQIREKLLDTLLTWEDLENFAHENDCEFKALDSHNEKLWGYFKVDYQFPNPNQLSLF